MKDVVIAGCRFQIRHDDGSYWATSPDMPDVIVAGNSIREVEALIADGIRFEQAA